MPPHSESATQTPVSLVNPLLAYPVSILNSYPDLKSDALVSCPQTPAPSLTSRSSSTCFSLVYSVVTYRASEEDCEAGTHGHHLASLPARVERHVSLELQRCIWET